MMAFIPDENIGFIVFSNSNVFDQVKVELTLETLGNMLEAKTGSPSAAKIEPEIIEPDAETIIAYEGKYVINGEIIEIRAKGKKLYAEYQGHKLELEAVDDHRFIFDHWLSEVSINAEFHVGSPDEEDLLIIRMRESFICPRYEELDEMPQEWETFIGSYRILPRRPSAYSDAEVLGEVEIMFEDGVLQTSNNLVLLPVAEDKVKIVGGVLTVKHGV